MGHWCLGVIVCIDLFVDLVSLCILVFDGRFYCLRFV